jgi:hypothetical protein
VNASNTTTHVVAPMMHNRNTGRAYAGVTLALAIAISLSGRCWGSVNFDGLRIVRVLFWVMSGVLPSLSQIAPS